MPTLPRARSIQEQTLFSAQAHRHYGFAANPPLSLKCMFNGSARYRVGRNRFAVTESGFLILNRGQPYEIEINSPSKVTSFVIFFPDESGPDVLKVLRNPVERLLADPEAAISAPSFFERFVSHSPEVTPHIHQLRRGYESSSVSSLWLEEALGDLLAALIRQEQKIPLEQQRLDSLRASTRQELWCRLYRARDYIRAEASKSLSLSDMARAAHLSPFHFQRSFRALFGISPHSFVSECRLETALHLLKRTDLPVTEICFESGFESLGTFSSWLKKRTGRSPRHWRQKSKIEEESPDANGILKL
jgi:AraC family transcriptional regulator